MEFILGDLDHSAHDVMEIIGYSPKGSASHGEDRIMVKKLGKSDFPRFHLSVTLMNGQGHKFVLYLENSTLDHDVIHQNVRVEEEMKRIEWLLMKPPK